MSLGIAIVMIMPVLITSASAPADEEPLIPGWLPHCFWGYAYLDGALIMEPDFTSCIDGIEYDESYFDPPSGIYCIEVIWDTNWKYLDEPVYVKDGAYFNDLVLFSIKDGGETYWACETMTWQLAGCEMIDMHFTSDGPPGLKINEICTDAGSGNQYCEIYNPTDSTVDLRDFYLEKDVQNSTTFMGDYPDYHGDNKSLNGIIKPGRTSFVRLSKGFMSSTCDELKLVWENPDLPVAGGNDIVVDRVEYGGQTTEPDNTIMRDADAPPTRYSIKRIVDGQDTDNCTADFETVRCQQSHEIEMIDGWNFISFPLEVDNTNLPDIMEDLNWTYILNYDATDQADHWKTNNIDRPDALDDLWELDHKMGFWLNSKDDGVLNITGRWMESTTIRLHAGWNMVGYPSMTERTMDVALSGISWDRAEAFDPDAPYLFAPQDGEAVMSPGNAYSIHVTEACDWIVDF